MAQPNPWQRLFMQPPPIKEQWDWWKKGTERNIGALSSGIANTAKGAVEGTKGIAQQGWQNFKQNPATINLTRGGVFDPKQMTYQRGTDGKLVMFDGKPITERDYQDAGVDALRQSQQDLRAQTEKDAKNTTIADTIASLTLARDGKAVEGSVANPKEQDTSVTESLDKPGVKSNNELVAEDQQLKGQGGRDLGATTRRNTANDVDTKSTIEKTEPQTPTTPTTPVTPVTQKDAESTMKISEMAGKAHTVLANLANIASILDTGTGPGATLHKRPSKTNTDIPGDEKQSSEGKTWDPDKQMWV